MTQGNEPGTSATIAVSPPDEQGNCFITTLGADGRPLPAAEPSVYDREGA